MLRAACGGVLASPMSTATRSHTLTSRVPRPLLVLWDIDGTLLRGGGVGRRAMEAAFGAVLGAAIDLRGVPFHGNTDPRIVSAGLAFAGVTPEAPLVTRVIDAYLEHLRDELSRSAPFTRLPGALELVDAFDTLGAGQGLGTGNVEAAAWMKVDAVGLGGRFRFGGFGSDHEDRGELLRMGLQRGASHIGAAPEACRVLVIGDTLRDIEAARAIGAEVVAVATGGDSQDALAAAEPDLVLPTLDAAWERVRALLG